MRLSCLPVSYYQDIARGGASFANWVTFAAGIGLDGVECSLQVLQPHGMLKAAEFRRVVEESGLKVSGLATYSDFTWPHAKDRARELQVARGNLETAVELGASVVRVLAGQKRLGVSESDGVGWVADALWSLQKDATELGVALALENHTKAFHWDRTDFAMAGEIYAQILDRLKGSGVGVLFDTANPLVAEEDPLELFDRVRDLIVYVHLNDVSLPGRFEFVEVGTGLAPIAEIVSRLSQHDYDGWLSIEEASQTGLDGLMGAARYVKGLLAMHAETDD